MPEIASREVHLASRPVGTPAAENFAVVNATVPEPGPGQIQVRNLWMSVDPYMRGRMSDRKSYAAPFEVGQVMTGAAVGEVVASNAEGFAPGDKVVSMHGWREAWTAALTDVEKLPDLDLEPQAFIGAAGMPGLTAYAGLLRIGALKDGETVLVSGAAGAVGSMVCQIAKAKGCRVVGSAGSAEKVAFLKEIGVDAAINYKEHEGANGLTKAFAAAAPDGVDVYFENVGGDHLTAALNVMALRGRIAVCGMISQYNNAEPEPGPPNLGVLIAKRLKIEGFLVFDNADMRPQFHRDLAQWVREGKVKWRETVLEGIEKAPEAFLQLFEGGNVGKMLVKLA
ncbi:MAG: NADP-dependent oxidoreductase [Maricaulaceae bacterium]